MVTQHERSAGREAVLPSRLVPPTDPALHAKLSRRIVAAGLHEMLRRLRASAMEMLGKHAA